MAVVNVEDNPITFPIDGPTFGASARPCRLREGPATRVPPYGRLHAPLFPACGRHTAPSATAHSTPSA
ncbi:hypothetical protein, partial [Streptomyces sp. TSRI0395]|uniref:hypothetical protein n=1 Tax=Streptomyces sp. TSRI0395 TaxID=1703923 RepID=UPI001A7E0FEC